MKDIIKISSIISSQLPSYISDDSNYETFISFLEAYYEWMENNNGVDFHLSNILDYADIDKTLDEFINYFYNEFMPSFPTEVLSDKRKLIKFSKELYKSKGTRASYKFLFRVLYDSQTEIVETKDFVLKCSDGVWFVPKSIKIKSNDSRFIKTKNLYVLGEDTKTLAKIETVKIVNDKIEIFISDIERLFGSSEYVRIVSSNIRDIYFDENGNIVDDSSLGEVLRARIVSSISSINIDKNRRGNYYNKGNPVVLHGGLEDPINGVGAQALIGDVTTGSIKSVTVDVSGHNWGYRDPYTEVRVNPDIDNQTIITVGTLDPSGLVTLDYIIKDSLELKEDLILYCDANTGYSINSSANYAFGGISSANANTIMKDVFTFSSMDTYKLSSLLVQNGGGGFLNVPTVKSRSMYQTNLPRSTVSPSYDPRFDFDSANANPFSYASIPDLGILSPIKIATDPVTGAILSGTGYVVGDEVLFTESVGSGAFARVASVNSSGSIQSVEFYQNPSLYAPLGGFGYYIERLPTITIQTREKTANTTNNSNIIVINSASPLVNLKIGQTITGNGVPSNTIITDINVGNNSLVLSNVVSGNYISNTYSFVGTGASLYVDGIMGGSASITPSTDRIGSISNIDVINYGEDYSSTPNVSLKIQDFAISNVNLIYPPQKGDIIYQGEFSNVSSYKAYVDSISLAEPNEDPALSKFIVRTYNYNTSVNMNDSNIYLQKMNMESPNTFSLKTESGYLFNSGYYGINESKYGSVTFGDGTGYAFAQFLNGLIIGRGRYVSEQGQPSSYGVLQDQDYNNYTYVLSVEKEISKFRKILYDLLHPAGTKVIGQTLVKSDIDSGIISSKNDFVNNLFNDFEFIFAGLSDEEETANLIQFHSSTKKYGTVLSNDSIQIYNFPSEISVGQYVSGNGIPYYSIIQSIDLVNNSITVSNNSTYTSNSKIIEFYDVTNYPDQGNSAPIIYYARANTVNGSNIIQLSSNSEIGLDGLKVDQTIKFNPINIRANISNNSNILSNVITLGSNVYVGQTISGKYIPIGTTVVQYYTGNNIIVMSNNATGRSNSSVTYYNKYLGSQVTKNNYIHLFNTLSDTTKIASINKVTNTIKLSSNCISSSQDSIFYFLGDGSSIFGGNNYVSIRTESGTIKERSY